MQFFLMVFVPPMVAGSNVFLFPCRNRRDLFDSSIIKLVLSEYLGGDWKFYCWEIVMFLELCSIYEGFCDLLY